LNDCIGFSCYVTKSSVRVAYVCACVGELSSLHLLLHERRLIRAAIKHLYLVRIVFPSLCRAFECPAWLAYFPISNTRSSTTKGAFGRQGRIAIFLSKVGSDLDPGCTRVRSRPAGQRVQMRRDEAVTHGLAPLAERIRFDCLAAISVKYICPFRLRRGIASQTRSGLCQTQRCI
jgi:hypothetical protein